MHYTECFGRYYCFSAYQGSKTAVYANIIITWVYLSWQVRVVATGPNTPAIRVREFVHKIVWFDKQNNLRTHVKLVYTGPIDQCWRHENLLYTVNPVYITVVNVLTVCLTLRRSTVHVSLAEGYFVDLLRPCHYDIAVLAKSTSVFDRNIGTDSKFVCTSEAPSGCIIAVNIDEAMMAWRSKNNGRTEYE